MFLFLVSLLFVFKWLTMFLFCNLLEFVCEWFGQLGLSSFTAKKNQLPVFWKSRVVCRCQRLFVIHVDFLFSTWRMQTKSCGVLELCHLCCTLRWSYENCIEHNYRRVWQPASKWFFDFLERFQGLIAGPRQKRENIKSLRDLFLR